jgi:type I restriction enzyme, S subunit
VSGKTIPAGWATATIGQIAHVIGGLTKNSRRERLESRLPFLRVANVRANELCLDDVHEIGVTEQELPRALLRPNDLLIVEGNGSKDQIGRVAIWPGTISPCVHQNHLIKVRLFDPSLSRFVLYWLLSPDGREQIERVASSTSGLHTLSLAKVSALTIHLAPVREATRIVAAIEEQFTRLDAAVSALERVRANLKRYRASLLKAACEGHLVPTEAELSRREGRVYEPADVLLERILSDRRTRWESAGGEQPRAKGRKPADDRWNRKFMEPEMPEVGGLPELPEGWVWTSLGQACEVFVGATPSRKVAEFWGGSIPWVSSGEVAFCRIRSTRERITEEGLRNTSTKVHPPGTVLIGMIGEGRTRGQVAVLDVEACNNQNCAAIRVPAGEILSDYVYYYLAGQYEVTRRVGSGNNQPALNKRRVERLALPLPPVAEQARIVEQLHHRLSYAASLGDSAENDIRRSTRLRQSILKRAFEGKLVPQDPADEPASQLLARIRAMRLNRSTTRLLHTQSAAVESDG